MLTRSYWATGLGIRLSASKNGPVFDSWIPQSTPKKFFYVADDKGDDVDVAGGSPREFQFALVRPKMVWATGNNSNVDRSAKGLFTAEKWDVRAIRFFEFFCSCPIKYALWKNTTAAILFNLSPHSRDAL